MQTLFDIYCFRITEILLFGTISVGTPSGSIILPSSWSRKALSSCWWKSLGGVE